MDREKVMKKWDYIHQLIKEDQGSLPRDTFESIIDGYEEEKETLKAEKTELVEAFLKYADHLRGPEHLCDLLKHSDYPCTCGFDETLARVTEE